MRNSLNVPEPLLVSCPNGGGMALLDGDLCLQLADADCTGIALAPDAVLWCLQEDGARSVRELRDGQLRTVSLSEEPLDLHDILLHGASAYVAATQANEVLRLDRRFVVRERWALDGEPDSCHVNSLAIHEGRLIASIFGRFSSHRGYKGGTLGAGEVIDVRSGESLIGGLSQPHSLVTDGGLLYLCSSQDKEVVVYEGRRKVRHIALPGYTRGLAIGRDHLYVGLSCSRNLEIESQTGYFESGAVAIVRRDDLQVLGAVQVPWREIYDIRIVEDRRLLQSLLAASWERERATMRSKADAARDQIREATEQGEKRAAVLRKELGDARVVAEQLRDAQRRATDAGQRVKVLEGKVSCLEEVVRKRSERLARVRKSHAETGALVIRRQVELEAKDAQLAELAATVRAHGEDINRQQATIRTLQEGIVDRDARIAELDAALAQSQAVETDQRRRIIELDAALAQVQAGEADQRRRAAGLAERVAYLQEVAREFELVKRSRSWRLTKPLRFAMRLLRNRGLEDDDRARLRALFGMVSGPVPMTPSLPSPTARTGEAADDGRTGSAGAGRKPAFWSLRKAPADVYLATQEAVAEDIYVWGVIDWHFRIQRPQHLARELAEAGRRVFYVSNNFVDAPEPGFKVEALDDSGRLFQVFLNVPGKPVIYFDPPDADLQACLDNSLRKLLLWTRSARAISLVQHPFWSRVARTVPNHRLVYDCMDHHGGFDNNGSAILALEEDLMRTADLLVVSSSWLDEEGARFNDQRALIRNAGQYAHFSSHPHDAFSDEQGRRVIGYYGAIASWFDLDLVERVARENSDCLVLLVGADTCNARERLAQCQNVMLTGEVPYAELPYYLYGFDVCMLPFKVLPLTLATNPVKAYEYLAAGKPVVSVDLPEMRQFGDLVRISADADGFLENIRRSLAEHGDDPLRRKRRAFAAEQTWAHRAGEMLEAIDSIREPRVSVVVLAYNNLELTKACLQSIERYSDYPDLEVIVVDNASNDGSPQFLREWAEGPGLRRLILNEDNKGFARGNNQGLAAATGDYLVLLNNDTQVTPGWVRTLRAHLDADPTIGIIGPVTNNIGNEARIETDYSDEAGMLAAATRQALTHAGELTPIRTVAFFCVMLPRSTYQRVGGLDEAFGVGFFEDDDYCRRVEALGLKVMCAEDVFVHHQLSASFNKLASGDRKELFLRNKAIYEEKWGEWVPHRYREADEA